MKAILICPDHREAAGVVWRMAPLALMPLMGRTLLDLWLEELATKGYQQVTILAADRPGEIREAVGNGARWGLKITLVPVPLEPTAEAARAVFVTDAETRIITLDSLPTLPDLPLWESTEGLYDVMRRKFGHIEAESCLTMRKIASDVFVSTRARIAPTVIIEGPAWIGPEVILGDHVHIKPGTIIESAAFIDHHACIRGSWIGPETYVGAMTEVAHSFAWGNGLENWRSTSFIEVIDDFLLASLNKKPFGGARCSWLVRASALLLMLLTAPLALACMAWARFVLRQPAFTHRQAISPPPDRQDRYTRSTRLHGLNAAPELFSRWPELWRVWRGDLHLVGNRPLAPADAKALGSEFEQLWLSAPAGVFSLADAMAECVGDETTLAHAAYYSVHRSLSLNWRIFLRCIGPFLTLRSSAPREAPSFPLTLPTA